ncbi:MTERFD1 [Symbiodinium natans]|uniref:mTERFD1 protein n=1 Tax=Symbiodinium natans TaxID=878477 RepID=A0A812LVV1_9DINO|nr:MTERFD1 [Symbiodinium natans]
MHHLILAVAFKVVTGESDLESESGEHLGQRAEDSDEDQRGAPASSSAAPVVVEDVDEADYLFLDARNSRAELLWLRFLQLRQWTLHRFSSRRAFAELLLQLERVDVRVQSGSWSLACLQLALQSLQKDRALWLYTSKLHLSPDDCSLLLGVDHRAVRSLFEAFNQYFVPIIDQLNDAIVVGGCSADVKLDEISFRSTGRSHGIVWLRYLAVARRGLNLVGCSVWATASLAKAKVEAAPFLWMKCGRLCFWSLTSQFWPGEAFATPMVPRRIGGCRVL